MSYTRKRSPRRNGFLVARSSGFRMAGSSRIAKWRRTGRPLWFQIMSSSALLLTLGLVSGLAPFWKREVITIFPASS